MVVKMSAPGRSFGGVADYCLHDPRMPGEAHHPESAERVEWTETRNLATSEAERAGRIMAATAEASPELKRLAGVAATGRKLEKPVCHYSLSWAKDETPDRQQMRWAAQESLKALGMGRHQALVVSHRDGQPARACDRKPGGPGERQGGGVEPQQAETFEVGEEYERVQGKIRCPQRERNNARRGQGKRVQDRVSRPTGRHRREEMNPQQQQRQAKIPAGRDGWGGPERERVAWQRAEERWDWEQLQRRRGKALGELEKRSKREWSALYGRHQQQREYLAKDCRGALGASGYGGSWAAKCERSAGDPGRQGSAGTLPGGVGGAATLAAGFVGKRASEAVRGIESKAGEFTARAWKGREKRARDAARTDGISVRYGWRRDQFDTFKYSMLEELLEQVREIDGELAYGKMRRALEKAAKRRPAKRRPAQEKARQARQVERARQVESARAGEGYARDGKAKQGGPPRARGNWRNGGRNAGAGAGLWPQPLVWSCSGGGGGQVLSMGASCDAE